MRPARKVGADVFRREAMRIPMKKLHGVTSLASIVPGKIFRVLRDGPHAGAVRGAANETFFVVAESTMPIEHAV